MLHINNKYIYINETSLSSFVCRDLINIFEEQENKFEGRTIGGMNKKIKDTIDFEIPANDKKWFKYHKLLKEELGRNLKKYILLIDNHNEEYNNITMYTDITEDTNINKFSHFKQNDKFMIYNFLMQKYDQNKGKYIYHNDSRIDIVKKEYRVITFLWYINSVDEGGETCFDNEIKIKPQEGKLILFPSCWTFPHCGKIPLSSNKYIITGWIYCKIDN
jgi:hypothetical protein